MAAATAAIWFDVGILRCLAKFRGLGEANLIADPMQETRTMNFNDIELRLRYPHIFRDHSDPHRAGPFDFKAVRAIETRKTRRSIWAVVLRRLFRKVP
jgi:hypothetical protein